MFHRLDAVQNIIMALKYASLKSPEAWHLLEKLEVDANNFQKDIKDAPQNIWTYVEGKYFSIKIDIRAAVIHNKFC